MSAVPGTVRMEMRIDVLERAPGELALPRDRLPGARASGCARPPGVKTYRNLKQVTDLVRAGHLPRASCASAGSARKGRVIRTLDLRTPRCEQPAPPPRDDRRRASRAPALTAAAARPTAARRAPGPRSTAVGQPLE